ncbi:IS110 family transposase [Pseudoalteromonas sp. MMG012]|uniref:IS110 family transposase n=1 Tax=Pseudoalteromonas sp. MMG012 TaxID=2822686 RepID=UPI001B3A2DF4|nr:IS110 family transposase [Pseudoalteromonas sp. MMG012]MBQ4852983.1 IS110 family transposase [Pseudoalteromonas sp. MMG012]
MNITTVGIDLAKNVSHVVCCNQAGKIVSKRMLRRSEILHYFRKLPCCLVGVEACASGHYWAREITKLGHTVKQIAPQHVKAYVRGNKTDYNDALAVAEAVVRPQMRFVTTKTVEQQDIQALHMLRKKCERDRTANANAIRGLLYEYGVTLNQGIKNVYKHLPELFADDADNGLSALFKTLLKQHYQKLIELDAHVKTYTKQIETLSQSEPCQRLQQIPGIGPITASAFYQHVGNGSTFKNGRAVSASLGVVPRQHSSGGKHNLLGISKRGDGYLRTLLIHGARAVMRTHAKKDTPLARWIKRIECTRGKNKAAVALANKMARVGWALLKHNQDYQSVHMTTQ